MSIKLTAKAWETNQSGNDLLVLLALCDFSNDEGLSFPSLKTLCNKAKVGKSTLAYILKAYEEIGVITRTRRTRDNNSDTSTLYQINHLNIDVNEYQKAYQKARNYTAKSDESSQCEHPSNDTNVNTGSEIVNTLTANCEHLESSSINHQDINQLKKINKKNFALVTELENEMELTESAKELLLDFEDYRKKINKPIKTIQPLKMFLNEIRNIYKNGIDVNEAIEIMKNNEWKSIKLEWILNVKNKSTQIVPVKSESKTFYQQTVEQKQQKEQDNLQNIANVRALMEQGIL